MISGHLRSEFLMNFSKFFFSLSLTSNRSAGTRGDKKKQEITNIKIVFDYRLSMAKCLHPFNLAVLISTTPKNDKLHIFRFIPHVVWH